VLFVDEEESLAYTEGILDSVVTMMITGKRNLKN